MRGMSIAPSLLLRVCKVRSGLDESSIWILRKSRRLSAFHQDRPQLKKRSSHGSVLGERDGPSRRCSRMENLLNFDRRRLSC